MPSASNTSGGVSFVTLDGCPTPAQPSPAASGESNSRHPSYSTARDTLELAAETKRRTQSSATPGRGGWETYEAVKEKHPVVAGA